VLQVDPVLGDRPADADPFDVRDHANWLDPVVELESGSLRREIETRYAQNLLAWRDWQTERLPGTDWKWGHFFASGPGNSGEFRRSVSVTGSPLVISQSRSLQPGERWLVIDAVRNPPLDNPCRIEVRINGQDAVAHNVPAHDPLRSELSPIVLPLERDIGRTAEACKIELRQLPDGVPVLWRSIRVVAQHPLVYRLFEDQIAPHGLDADRPNARRLLDDQERYTGRASIRLAAGESVSLPLDHVVAVRDRPQLGEYRFLRLAARQANPGRLRVMMKQPANGRTVEYQSGENVPVDASLKRIPTQPLAAGWWVATRDLFGDFGNLDLDSLMIQAEGTEAWVDHIYLARNQQDFGLIKAILEAD
jgi:hypothetical protein